jgi:molybdate transport system ATP-binding protein
MKFDLDIMKSLKSGDHEFRLRSTFSTTDKALVLFGPSGSGKTLTLQAVAGLLTPDEGRITVDGHVLFDSAAGVNLPTRKRGVGYVFQDYALFPHMTVWNNVAFGLRTLMGKLSSEDKDRVDELLSIFGLDRRAKVFPSSLSGGQKQRTAMARALAPNPRILLLDEPFSALDQPLRLRMRMELTKVIETFDIPIVLVTHDADEVEAFAETVVVYHRGQVVGIHSAAEISARGESLAETVQKEVAAAYDV